MERLLTAPFAKKHKFLTKRDLMTFIETVKPIKHQLVNYDTEIEEFKEIKLEEFERVLEEYESEMRKFQLSAKEREAQRKSDKKQMEKDTLKDQLRDEIRKEMEMERLQEEHSDYIPQIKSHMSLNTQNLLERFIETLKGKKLSKTQLGKVKKAKTDLEKAIELLRSVELTLVELK